MDNRQNTTINWDIGKYVKLINKEFLFKKIIHILLKIGGDKYYE